MVSMVMVNDGTTMWMYMPMANSLLQDSARGPISIRDSGGHGGWSVWWFHLNA